MAFDIRNYYKDNTNSGKVNEVINKRFAFLKYIKENEPMIQQECEALVNGLNERTEEAFTKKINGWKGLLENMDILCQMYRVS